MKKICINPVFMALQGNFAAQDEHGHKEVLRFRETSWGTKSFGLGGNPKRDLTVKPYSDDEVAQHNAFKNAVTLRQLINDSPTLKNTWRAKFATEMSAGTTKCKTLNGYLIRMALKGKISDQGQPVA